MFKYNLTNDQAVSIKAIKDYTKKIVQRAFSKGKVSYFKEDLEATLLETISDRKKVLDIVADFETEIKAA